MWGHNRPLLKSRQNPQSCGFESTTIAEHCGSPTGDWNGGKRTPSARGGQMRLGLPGGEGSKKARCYELFEARQPIRSPAASVTQTPHSRQLYV